MCSKKIQRAVAPVQLRHVRVRRVHVVLHHLAAGVPQDPLWEALRPAAARERHARRVPEEVRMLPLHAGLPAEALHEPVHRVARHPPLIVSRPGRWFTGVRRHGLHIQAGSRRSRVPRSSVRKRMAQQPSVAVGRNATGCPRSALGSRNWRPWKDTQPPAWTRQT